MWRAGHRVPALPSVSVGDVVSCESDPAQWRVVATDHVIADLVLVLGPDYMPRRVRRYVEASPAAAF